MKKIVLHSFIFMLAIFSSSGIGRDTEVEIMMSTKNNDYRADKEKIKMIVLYDNYVNTDGTEAKWGFSCLIQTGDKNILFDTGGDGEVLLHNIHALNVDISSIDVIVISHNHWDHTGGLFTILESTKNVPVYLLNSFPTDFIEKVRNTDSEVILVKEPIKICENVMTTGEISGPVNEQSLIVHTKKGPVLVTGCSHPGIVNIVRRANEISGESVYLVFGGFHLMQLPDDAIDGIISDFHQLGVKKCGATHCTGDRQIKRFKDAYQENYEKIGTGKVLEF